MRELEGLCATFLGFSCKLESGTQAKALRKRREMQRHIYFAEPVTPQAGRPVTLFYNPDTTALRGRPEIWVRGGFNRWGHPQKLGPVQMQSVVRGGVGFHKTVIQVSPARVVFTRRCAIKKVRAPAKQ